MVSLFQSSPLYVVYFGLPRFALPTHALRPRASQAARVVGLLQERVHVLPVQQANEANEEASRAPEPRQDAEWPDRSEAAPCAMGSP